MWTITCRRLRKDCRGVSNIIVVVLSLLIILAIVSDIVLWNYEMNQLDWDKMREDISIPNVESDVYSSWFGTQNEYAVNTGMLINGTYADTQISDNVFESFMEDSFVTYNPSSYSLGGSTSWVSGNISDLASDDDVHMIFRSYSSGTDTSDFVDNNTANVDSSADKGTHSNFAAEQAGPDSAFDNLAEEETGDGSGYRVQQGDFLFQGTDAYIPLTYPVDTDHAVVLMPNLMWQENVTAGTGGDSAMNSDDALATAYLYNSTHIRVQRWTSSDGDLRIGWQVLECFDDEFTVQRGETSLSSFTGQNVVATIPSPVDPARSMAWHYLRTSYTGRDGRATQFYSNVTDSSTIAFQRQGTTSVTGYLRWIVLEWDLSKIDHFAQGYVTGYGRDSSPFMDSIGTPVNESQSLLIFQTHAIGDDGLDTSTTVGYLSNSTHVAFHNYDSSNSRGVKWYVIDFGSGVGSKQYDNYVSWQTTDYVNDDALSPAVQLNRTLVWLSGACNGDGTAKPRHTQWWVLNPMNSTHSDSLHYERRYGGQQREIAWQLLELPYSPLNYELDLEVQFTNVDYDETNEELCIYGGTMDTENIEVDVWNGISWENLFTDLNSGWNNVSVSSYLTSSTFTIRFKGGTEINDNAQSSWNIDATLLHVLSDEYTTEVEFTGSSDTEDWSQLIWTVDSAWTTGSVDVTMQLYNYTLGAYPTSGNGYINYISNATADTDETKSQTIAQNSTNFRNATSNWKLKIKGVKATDASFDFKADFVELYVTATSPTNYKLDISGNFAIDLSTYPLEDIRTVEIQLRYRADDSAEKWYLQAYNWTASAYSDVGFNSTAGHTPTTGWDYYAVNLTDVWQSYVHSNGTVRVRFVDQGGDSDQTSIDVDFLGVRVEMDWAQFTFENDGGLTVHLVSLWIINATTHQQYDISVFVNSAETKTYLRTDISLATGSYRVKVVTERGNTAVYSGS